MYIQEEFGVASESEYEPDEYSGEDDDDDDEEDENDEEGNQDNPAVEVTSPVKDKSKRRSVPGPAAPPQATHSPPSERESAPEKRKKATPKRKKASNTPAASSPTKTKKARMPVSQVSLIDNSDDEVDITENADNVENEDPEETAADKRRRLAASRLKVSTCCLKKHHCWCAEFDGCHGCGERINMTQSKSEEDWICPVRADRFCHLSQNYKHVCSECTDDAECQSTSDEIHDDLRCLFPFMGSHCGCLTACCGCSRADPENQQCLNNGARICEFSSGHDHYCSDCYDYYSDAELSLMLK